MKKPRYSTNKYIILITASATIGLIISVILMKYILGMIGVPDSGIIRIIVFCFPFIVYACLKGFHVGLIKHYGFKDPFLNNGNLGNSEQTNTE